MRYVVRTVARVIMLLAAVGWCIHAAAPVNVLAQSATRPPVMEIEHIQGTLFLITGAGANITLSAGADGLLMVDSGDGKSIEGVVEAISRMPAFLELTGTKKPGPAPIEQLRYVVNTSALEEHSGGNAALSRLAGAPPLQIFGHENALNRVAEEREGKGDEPTLTFFGRRMAISRFFNGEAVELVHLPSAITDGDVVVRFYRSGVVATGAIFDYTQFPKIDLARGGSINGLIDALNRVLEMVIPGASAQGGTYVIGAHGRICDIAELANYRNMVTIVRDRVAALIEEGMSLEQVQATRPTIDYDTRWGRNPDWTPAQFVEAVYQSLKTPVN